MPPSSAPMHASFVSPSAKRIAVTATRRAFATLKNLEVLGEEVCKGRTSTDVQSIVPCCQAMRVFRAHDDKGENWMRVRAAQCVAHRGDARAEESHTIICPLYAPPMAKWGLNGSNATVSMVSWHRKTLGPLQCAQAPYRHNAVHTVPRHAGFAVRSWQKAPESVATTQSM